MQTKSMNHQKNNQEIINEELIQQLQAKEIKALEILYEYYKGALYGIILRIVKIEVLAEEILQDVFVKIWQNIDKYDPQKGRLFTWMIKIARNLAIDELRSKAMKTWIKQSADPNFDWQQLESTWKHHLPVDLIGLEYLLKYLNIKQQRVMQLIYMEGYTHQEVAQECNLPLGTVKTLIRTGLITLKKILSTFEKEEILFPTIHRVV